MGNKISTYTAITTLANGDLLDISKDMGASTYATRKITYANLLTELNTDLTFPVSSNLGNANLTADNAARTYTLAGTSTESLAFLNGSAAEILKLKGDRTILFGGYTTNGFVKTSAGTGLITVSTQVSATEGGTGRSSWTANALPYISATNTFGEILAGTNGNVLTMVAGVPSWAAISAPNLGSANLTSSDDARTFTLKTGTTATQNFQIKNSAGKVGYYFDGANSIAFRTTSFNSTYGGSFTNFNIGESANPVAMAIHLDSVSNSQYYAYRHFAASKVLMNVEARGAYQWFNQTSNSNTDIEFTLYGNGARIVTNSPVSLAWQTGYAHYYNGIVQARIYTTNQYHGQIDLSNSSGTVKAVLSSSRSGSEAVWFADGLVLGGTRGRSATPFFDVMGSGSTSATTTALFQNSSSSTVAEFKDDLTSSFGGVVTAPQIINTPNVISVTSNAGTITRAYRENKFTNSSAAAMTITMSTTGALDGDVVRVRIYDFSAAAQTISWVNTENSTITVPTTSNGSTTLPLTVGFQYNSATSKWRCIGSV